MYTRTLMIESHSVLEKLYPKKKKKKPIPTVLALMIIYYEM